MSSGPSIGLPVDEPTDVALAALLAGPGCPLCRLRSDASRRYLRSILYESVNDVGFRERLLAGRGFCRDHGREALALDRAQSGGSLGAAILFASIIGRRLEELRSPTERGGRRRRRGRAPADDDAARCPVCEKVVEAQDAGMGRLLERLSVPAWRETLAAADLCMADLLVLGDAARRAGSASWTEVAEGQSRRVEGLQVRLRGFIHHSGYDRRDLMTDDERRASDEAAAFLGYAEHRGRR